jgi:hypothetical protein
MATTPLSIGQDIKDYIDQRDSAVEERVKTWLIKAVLAQLVAFVPVIFFLGGIYSQNAAALKMLESHRAELADRGVWMDDREKWELSVEQQWGRKSFTPPRTVRK